MRSEASIEAAKLTAQVRELAARVDRLTIQRRDPEAFFVERSAIVGDLRRLARVMGRQS
jgi:hypothetical protein